MAAPPIARRYPAPLYANVVRMNRSQGFAPVARADARILILGSMPGVASLVAAQYYAFPRNAFWRIMGDLFGAGPQLDYPARLHLLNDNRIALWDVIQACVRPGSLDSSILDEGMETNDFSGFFERHPHIGHVCFNGRKAADLFERRVKPGLALHCEYHVLPSTSPANAGKDYAAKLNAWSLLKEI